MPARRRRQVSSRSEEHTSELQSRSDLVCRLLLEKKKTEEHTMQSTRTRRLPAILAVLTGVVAALFLASVFFLMIRRPPRSTLFPYTNALPIYALWRMPRMLMHASAAMIAVRRIVRAGPDRKSTRLNSSHDQISYAVFCLKKKKKNINFYILIKNNKYKL